MYGGRAQGYFQYFLVLLTAIDFGTDVLFVDQMFFTKNQLEITGQSSSEEYQVVNSVIIGSIFVLCVVGLTNVFTMLVAGNFDRRYVLFKDEIEEILSNLHFDCISILLSLTLSGMLLCNFMAFSCSFTNSEMNYEFYCADNKKDYRHYVLTSLSLIFEDVPQFIIQAFWATKVYAFHHDISMLNLFSLAITLARLFFSFGIKLHSLWIYIENAWGHVAKDTLSKLKILFKCFLLAVDFIAVGVDNPSIMI
jgi:hypothetical protein